MPPMLQALVHRLVRWGVMPRSKAPDSAIINIYDQVCALFGCGTLCHCHRPSKILVFAYVHKAASQGDTCKVCGKASCLL